MQTPFLRMPWREAMDRFGSDKPDMRFGFELQDISDLVKDCGFGVFAEPVKAGGSVRLINVNGHAKDFPRKKIDKLGEFVKTYKAKGLAWARMLDGKVTSSYQKFLTDEENAAILERAGAKDGDLILIVGDVKDEVVFASLGALRMRVRQAAGHPGPQRLQVPVGHRVPHVRVVRGRGPLPGHAPPLHRPHAGGRGQDAHRQGRLPRPCL